MVITRTCDQCGASFAPRREHARFCSVPCRVAWNEDHLTDLAAEVNALAWSVIAMADATSRLVSVSAWDRPRAFAVVSEAVWWVTIVDSTLVRYHSDTYDLVLSDLPGRSRVEETLAGLRYVRNQIGQDADHVDFIAPTADLPDCQPDLVGDWTWRRQPEPACATLSPQGTAWEMTRYQAYQTRLAGHTVSQTFGDAAGFLKLAADRASATTADELEKTEGAARTGSPLAAGQFSGQARAGTG